MACMGYSHPCVDEYMDILHSHISAKKLQTTSVYAFWSKANKKQSSKQERLRFLNSASFPGNIRAMSHVCQEASERSAQLQRDPVSSSRSSALPLPMAAQDSLCNVRQYRSTDFGHFNFSCLNKDLFKRSEFWDQTLSLQFTLWEKKKKSKDSAFIVYFNNLSKNSGIWFKMGILFIY